MTANDPMPTWRNALSWAAVGFVFCGIAMLGTIAVVQVGGLRGFFDSDAAALKSAAAWITVSLVLAAAVVGFSQRKAPLRLRTLRAYVFSNVLAISGFALAAWIYHRLAGALPPGAMDVSAKVALILGLTLVVLAIACVTIVVVANSRVSLLTAEQTEDTRERGRMIVYSAIWLATTGLTLGLLSLAGPAGAVSPAAALAGVIVLLGIGTAVNFATVPLLDELWQVLSRETGSMAFYLVFTVGGGWAILAHLGFVRAPAPLDWLTMLVVIIFAASLIAIGRRGLLQSR